MNDKRTPWKSVNDPPTDNNDVVITDGEDATTGYYCYSGWISYNEDAVQSDDIEYWIDIPDVPVNKSP